MALSAFMASSASAGPCGDGIVDGGHEECDDGGTANGDGCDSNCQKEECGNGFVQVGEECDPGTGTTGDPKAALGNAPDGSCDEDCTLVVCGDGLTNGFAGEQCDEGDPNSAPGFSDSATCNNPSAEDTSDPNAPVSVGCKTAGCPDGYVNVPSGEECEDGNAVTNDLCNNACLFNLCGNGRVDKLIDPNGGPVIAEFCDPNTGISPFPQFALAGTATCTQACTPNACGDTIVNAQAVPPEQCDPPGGSCTGSCQMEQCGNGVVNIGSNEDCDPGDPNDPTASVDATDPNGNAAVCAGSFMGLADGAPCTIDATCLGGSCTIDHTNDATSSSATCNVDCTDSKCGDGLTNTLGGETCDPDTGTTGNPLLAAGNDPNCDENCTSVVCGDGLINFPSGETCDEGDPNSPGFPDSANCNGPGAADPNGVSKECLLSACGDFYANAADSEVCDDGNNMNSDGCRGDCAGTELCGDGLNDVDEFCDPNTGHAGGADPNANTTGTANADIAGCDFDCTNDFCRDGYTNTVSEECDDDNAVDFDFCNNGCEFNLCGNGRLDTIFVDPNTGPLLPFPAGTTEFCDPNTGNSGQPNGALLGSATCTQFCTPQACGDGIVNPPAGEECDAAAVCAATGNQPSAPCPTGPNPTLSLIPCEIATGFVVFGAPSTACSGATGLGGCGQAAECVWTGFPTNPFSGCRAGATAGTGFHAGLGVAPGNAPCNSIQCGDGDANDPGEACDPGPSAVLAKDPNGADAVCVGTAGGILDGIPCSADGITAIPGIGCLLGSCSIDHSNDATSNTASCDVDCTAVVCGDGLVNTLAAEQCDDRGECPDMTACTVGDPNGPTNTCGDPLACLTADDDGCNLVCLTEFCGDGIVQTGIGEECDPNGPFDTAACNGPSATGVDPNGLNDPNVDLSCTLAACGDGHRNTDPNTNSGLGETCDDGCLQPTAGDCGDNANNDGCSKFCQLEACGDGFKQTVEVCDDGNTDCCDGCSSLCDSVEDCGGGVTDNSFPDPNDNETCDDGNTTNNDGCSEFCQDEVCGNGIQPLPQSNPVPANQCDDGNAVNDDGCTNDCKDDPDTDGAPAGADTCAAIPPLADKRLKLNKLDESGNNRITATGSFSPEPNEPDVTDTGIQIQLLNDTTVLYNVCISGNLDAPGGEYLRTSTTPACGNKKDGWASKITQSGAKFDYKNKTGVAPKIGDSVGACTGSAEGVRKVFLKDLGNGTWKYKIDIRDMDLLALPANDGSKVLGRLQLQLAFENCLTDDPTDAGTAGHCLDLQFDEGSCKVKTGFGGLRKVVCK